MTEKQERKREQARLRQQRRRKRLKQEGVTVTITLTHQESEMLEELKTVRRMGRQPYTTDEFFQLLLIRNYQEWQQEKPRLGLCEHCGKSKAEGGCKGENQKLTTACWLTLGANSLNL